MTPEQEAQKERKLRLLESAAASALYNGATPEEARARVEVGIAETLASPIYKGQQERAQAAAQ
jgi:hypothetical protein